MNGMSNSSRNGLTTLLWLANALFALVLCLAIWFSYQQHLHYAEDRAANTTLALERSLSGMLEEINLILDSVEHELESQRAAGRDDQQAMNAMIRYLVRDFPWLKAVLYADASGQIGADSGYPAGNPEISIQDRDYYQWLRAHPDAGMVSSRPVIGRLNGLWVLVFARPYYAADNKFAGVVLASVDLDYFSGMFAAVKLSGRSRVALIDRNYERVAAHPALQDPSRHGQFLAQEEVIRQLETGLSARAAVIRTQQDNIQRLYHFRKLGSRPYWIMVALSVDDELASWRQQVWLALVVLLIFAALTGAAGWQLQKGWRRREKALATLESTLEATDNGILVLDNYGRVQHSNQRFFEMWRISQLLVGQGDQERLLEQARGQLCDPEGFLRHLNSAPDSADRTLVDSLVFRDGRIFEQSSRAMLLHGELQGRVWSYSDVSEREQRAAELENHRHHLEALVEVRTRELALARDRAEFSNRAKSVFLSNMSHELRTPLNAILGFAQLLTQDSALGAEQLKKVAIIDRSGKHLLALINDVLEITSIESGRSSIECAPFNLLALLSSIEEMIRVHTDAKELTFLVEQGADLPACVAGDGPHLKRVLINLLGNAVKYTEQGSIRLRVRRRNGDIEFEIADTGPGIAADDQERIFNTFYQTEVGIVQGEGTGLGLAISREYTQQMGGRLTVASRLGQGSVFTLILPLPAADASVAQAASGPVVGLEPGQEEVRVLVVDTQSDSRELLLQQLDRAGFKVRTAENGQQAAEVFSTWQPRFIWMEMDLCMPKLDGYALIRQLRALPNGDRVTIVAMTSSAFDADRRTLLAAGCDELVLKPLDEDRLFAVMGERLGLHYLYASEAALPLPRVAKPDFSVLSADLLRQLNAAAEALDVEVVRHVVANLGEAHPELAAALDALMQSFRFDQISTLCNIAAAGQGLEQPEAVRELRS